jgi:hypothetical protein
METLYDADRRNRSACSERFQLHLRCKRRFVNAPRRRYFRRSQRQNAQKTLPFGTPEEVYEEVRERIDIFAANSGYVFNSIHNIQSDVPTRNILAMFKAIDDVRK